MRGHGLAESEGPLAAAYDVVLCDLDGVVYVGDEAVPHAVDALERVRQTGGRLGFVTNNAARSPQAVADQISALGVRTSPDEVVTSAQAAADLLARDLPAGSSVLVVGAAGLVAEISSRGLVPVRQAGADHVVAAVVQGHDPQTGWPLLAEAAVAIARGARWVATNDDATLPSPRGLLPGNGAMVAALRTATGAVPEVAGKPSPPLYRSAQDRFAARRPLFVGDRLDTDVRGAVEVGMDALLVLTGVSSLPDLLGAAPGSRPSFVAPDLRALHEPHPRVEVDGETGKCDGAVARWVNGQVEAEVDTVAGLRAACALSWARADAGLAAAGA